MKDTSDANDKEFGAEKSDSLDRPNSTTVPEEEDETNTNAQKLLEKASQMLMPEPHDEREIAEMESPPTGNDFNQWTQ